MHDINFIRKNPEIFEAGMIARGMQPDSVNKLKIDILKLDEEKRKAQTDLQELQSKKNQLAKAIGQAKAKGENVDVILEDAARVKAAIEHLEELSPHISDDLDEILASLPNIPADDVPVGPEETHNKVLRTHGTAPKFAFAPKEHFDLAGSISEMMDFERAAKISGARFVVLKGQLARLERALASFMLDQHTKEFGYTEIVPPLLVKSNAMFGTGQLPKFEEDLFISGKISGDDSLHHKIVTKGEGGPVKRIEIENHYWLIPTSEVPLTNLVADEILNEADLPLRFTAYTPCFRAEAGSAGKDTRGLIRHHQFSKVEMVSITHPDQSAEEHERMTSSAEKILQKLELHYQVVLLSSVAGFCNKKTYDLEVWLPGQNAFREISSCSNCGDFQARRMKARFKSPAAKGTQFVHTLNGSGLAIGRTIVAILENYQQADGSVLVPEVLKPYMGGLEKIG